MRVNLKNGKSQRAFSTYLVVFLLKKGSNATQVSKKQFVMYETRTKMLHRNASAKNGLQNFVLVISMLKEPRSGRPVEIDSDEMKALVDENRRYATRDVAKISNVSKSSVANHLEAFGYVGKLDV